MGFHYLSADIWGDFDSVDVKFKIRHTPEFASGLLTRREDPVYGKVYHLSSDTKIQGIASGQYATVYDNEARLVVASGMIA